MCLSSVYIDSNGQQEEVMRDVAQMEAKNNGFVLTGLLGEQKFVQGKVSRIDFVNKHLVVLKKGNISSFTTPIE
jgi:predicted RNA-binding protein